MGYAVAVIGATGNVGREMLGEDTEHLPADIAGRANDGDGVTHS